MNNNFLNTYFLYRNQITLMLFYTFFIVLGIYMMPKIFSEVTFENFFQEVIIIPILNLIIGMCYYLWAKKMLLEITSIEAFLLINSIGFVLLFNLLGKAIGIFLDIHSLWVIFFTIAYSFFLLDQIFSYLTKGKKINEF